LSACPALRLCARPSGGSPAIARTGILTASVSAADVFEILGAAPRDAASAATALREAPPRRGERLRAGTPLTAWFGAGPDGAGRLTGVSARVSPTATLMAVISPAIRRS